MKAKKSNRSYDISPNEAKRFQAQGYDIYENGRLIMFGAGKTVSAEKYVDLLNENARLKEQIAKMAEKLEKKEKK